MDELDLGSKIAIGCISGLIVSIIIGVVGCEINNNRLIKEGYEQKNITYCATVSTKTIWIKP